MRDKKKFGKYIYIREKEYDYIWQNSGETQNRN